jgi:hypothetical protein
MAKKIAVVGRPRTGKTTLAKKLSEDLGLALHHTDDSINKIPFKDTDRHWINKLSGEESYIVEGVQVSRMLRSGGKDGSWKPDKLIVVEASHPVRKEHKGLASLCKSAVDQWCESNPDVEVERVYNDFELPRQGYMSEARKKLNGPYVEVL